MVYTSLKMTPGIDVEKSPLLNSSGWSYSVAIRWRDGQPEKIGGWTALNATPLVGVCTGMHSWADLGGNLYIACGTDQRLEVFYGGLIVDITPLRQTTNNAPQFTTISGSQVVNIKDAGNGALAGDWINITVPVSVGGIVLMGFYQVVAVIDANNYTIMSATPAATSITDGGAVPVFDTTITSGDVQVTLADHGYSAGGVFAVQVETVVGGITIAVSVFTVVAPVTTDTFIIQPGGVASSTATASENSGHARIEYLIPTGLQSASYQSTSGGYGVGPYGSGPYGIATSGTVLVPLRQWFLDNFGEDLVGNYTKSPIFIWMPPVTDGNVALAIDTSNFPSALDPPTEVIVSFVAAPQQMIIALGCNVPGTGTFDPNMVRWCDQADYTDWAASSTNMAGSYRIPSGSQLVGGLAAPNFIAIWTDTDMWLMSYLGGQGSVGAQLVWGFTKIMGSTGLLSARSCAIFRNLIFYLSSDGMYMFNGNALTLVPCPVWDKFWKNLNREQVDKVNLQVNSFFQEVAIAFPSLTGNGTVDSRVTYNIRENIWTYDDAPTLTSRTAWHDENVYGSPAGTDLAGYIQQQDSEGVYDADGTALAASVRTGWFSAQEGTLLSMMERIEADMIVTGGTGTIFVTVYAKDYAVESTLYPVRTYGPYPWVAGEGPPWAIVRARGRFLSIEVGSEELGIFWRLGNMRFDVRPSGKRP